VPRRTAVAPFEVKRIEASLLRGRATCGVTIGAGAASDHGLHLDRRMRLEDYAIVGDTQTIALVGRSGSVGQEVT